MASTNTCWRGGDATISCGFVVASSKSVAISAGKGGGTARGGEGSSGGARRRRWRGAAQCEDKAERRSSGGGESRERRGAMGKRIGSPHTRGGVQCR
jgi:hypothetical protein